MTTTYIGVVSPNLDAEGQTVYTRKVDYFGLEPEAAAANTRKALSDLGASAGDIGLCITVHEDRTPSVWAAPLTVSQARFPGVAS